MKIQTMHRCKDVEGNKCEECREIQALVYNNFSFIFFYHDVTKVNEIR